MPIPSFFPSSQESHHPLSLESHLKTLAQERHLAYQMKTENHHLIITIAMNPLEKPYQALKNALEDNNLDQSITTTEKTGATILNIDLLHHFICPTNTVEFYGKLSGLYQEKLAELTPSPG